MNPPDTSLRLRLWASLLIFVSGYAPLLVILAVKDLQFVCSVPVPNHPWLFGIFVSLAVLSSVMVLGAVKSIRSGLAVEVTKASNKSGEMFGYTIPYVLSFVRIDLGEWQTLGRELKDAGFHIAALALTDDAVTLRQFAATAPEYM